MKRSRSTQTKWIKQRRAAWASRWQALKSCWLGLVAFQLCIVPLLTAEFVQEEAQQVAPAPAPTEIRFRKPVVINFDGMIDWNNSTYFHNRIARAKRKGADLLIVRIDSPGGLVSESLRMGETLRDIDWAYTIAFVPDEAISGAALFSLGCDEIIVSKNATFGDVGAIQYDPELFAFRYVPAKAQSVLVSEARELAQSKNRSPEMAEAMIDKDALLFQGKGDARGEFRIARLQDPKDSPKQVANEAGLDLEQWELVPEAGVERFLTLNGDRMTELGLATANQDTVDSVLEYLDADRAALTTFKYNTTDSIVHILNNPIVTALLVIVGIIALYIEFSAPGVGAGGLIALLCAAIFFWSRFMGGTSGLLEVTLFICGVVFLLMEVFVIPGWGIAGFGGLALILASAVLAGLDFVLPESSRQWNQLMTNVLLILCSGVIGLIALSWLARKMGSLPVLNRLILNAESGTTSESDSGNKADGKLGNVAHPLVSVGDWGIADSVLRPAGRARFGHESVDVVSEGSFISAGDSVKVIEINGNRIVVAAVEAVDETAVG